MDNFLYLTSQIEEMVSNQKSSNLKKEYTDISLQYRKEKINSKTIISNSNQALSYVSSRMPETAVVINNVLSILNKIINISNEINSVLDLGSGTGSALWALENFLKSNTDVLAIEKQEAMLNCSKELSKNLNLNIDYMQEDVLSKAASQIENKDMVLESFMLNEMSENDRRKTLDLMISKSDKLIILIEPGTPVSYQKMMQDRDYLLSKDLHLILPCMHANKCPLQNDYCNFSVRVNRTKISKQIKNASLGYEDEKYFYLIFSKQPFENKFDNMVLRKPVYRKSCVDLKLCNNCGDVKNITITKNNKQNYATAKDLKHGDLFKLEK